MGMELTIVLYALLLTCIIPCLLLIVIAVPVMIYRTFQSIYEELFKRK